VDRLGEVEPAATGALGAGVLGDLAATGAFVSAAVEFPAPVDFVPAAKLIM
jgi:hypothetical protein